MSFVAIDFETADFGRDSACAIALVRVEGNEIVDKTYSLIRPPRARFQFTYIHGITWEQVRHQPTFGELWPEMSAFLAGAEYFVAHNATFDKGVLEACCAQAGLPPPRLPFRCTVKLARQVWRLPSNKLNLVCEHLQIPLNHHNALSDAEACARIVMEAGKLRTPTALLKSVRW
jgi:DNA polymerase III subunit epsilon